MALLLAGCAELATLDPMGPAAARIAQEFWWLYWSAFVVVVVVFAILSVALFRRRRGAADDPAAERKGYAFVLYGGGLVPLILIGAITFFLVADLSAFDGHPPDDAVNVRITGHMFWWEIEYMDDGFSTANELHVPVGQPVNIELESADVIHSFWVPQLHGKLELVPGRTNHLTIQADAPGSYDGYCAEFCGVQHTNMRLIVTAQMPDDYQEWVGGQQREAALPDAEDDEADLIAEGAAVFGELACSNCHSVRGVSEAAVDAGPDLTHVASRSTLAARTIPNTDHQMRLWVVNPQAIKPGTRMPPTAMEPGQLDALLAFLRSLR